MVSTFLSVFLILVMSAFLSFAQATFLLVNTFNAPACVTLGWGMCSVVPALQDLCIVETSKSRVWGPRAWKETPGVGSTSLLLI